VKITKAMKTERAGNVSRNKLGGEALNLTTNGRVTRENRYPKLNNDNSCPVGERSLKIELDGAVGEVSLDRRQEETGRTFCVFITGEGLGECMPLQQRGRQKTGRVDRRKGNKRFLGKKHTELRRFKYREIRKTVKSDL